MERGPELATSLPPLLTASHRGHTEKLWWGPKFVLEGGATSTVCITAENFRFSACTRPPPGAGPRGLLAGCAGAKLGWSRHFFVEAQAAQNRGRGTRPRAARRPHGCDAVRKSGKDTRSTKRKEKQPRMGTSAITFADEAVRRDERGTVLWRSSTTGPEVRRRGDPVSALTCVRDHQRSRACLLVDGRGNAVTSGIFVVETPR